MATLTNKFNSHIDGSSVSLSTLSISLFLTKHFSILAAVENYKVLTEKEREVPDPH